MGSNSNRYDESYNLMEESILKAAAEVMEGAGHVTTERGNLVTTESPWSGEYIFPPAIEEMYRQAMRTPQLSTSSLQVHHRSFDSMLAAQNAFKANSAFVKYKKESPNGFHLSRKCSMKQKSLKRCFDFFRRIYQNERANSSWEVDDRLLEESYASAHRIAERNRRNKLSQQFLALRSLLPHNPKKSDKHSILSSAIVELNQQKLRITELEQRNKTLMDAVTQNICEDYSSLSHGNAEDSGNYALKSSICEEAVVVVEESEIADEAVMHVTLKNVASNSTDAIISLFKCLGEMKLGVARIQCRELDSINPVIEVTVQRQTMAGEWEPFERKQLEEMVKRALNPTKAASLKRSCIM